MPEIYTIPDVAQILRVSDRTVRRILDRGELKYCKFGGSIRIDKQDLEFYINRSKSAPACVSIPARKDKRPGRPPISGAPATYHPGMKVV